MEFLQELFVTGLLAIVFSTIVAISIAMAGSEEKNDCNKKENKMVMEEVKLDKRLKVEGGRSKKRVKFADDVVVNNVDRFEPAKEPIKDFELSEKLSAKVGFLEKLADGVIVGEESKEANINKVDDQFGGKEGVKESEIMLSSGELIKECNNANISRKGEASEEKGCKDAGLLDKALGKEVVEQKTEATKADEFHGLEAKSEMVGCLEALDVGDEMMSEEIGADPVLELGKGDVGINQKGGDEAGESETNPSESLDKALEAEATDKKSRRPEVNLDISCVRVGLEDVVVDEKLKGEVLDGQEEVMAHDDTAVCQNAEGELVGFGASDAFETKEGLGKRNELEVGLKTDKDIDDDDDWEGVESSDLEKVFAEAVNYVECGGKGKDDQLANVGSDVQMQLYGLQRLALEGPCHEPQPMALKVSARAKWNAWQKLGSMSPEVAMEQYIKLLSDTYPGWMQHSSAHDGNHGLIGSGLTGSPESKKSLPQDIQADTEDARKLKMEPETVIDGNNLSSGAKTMKEISE